MECYPVSMTRRYYRGNDPRKQAKAREFNRVAARIDEYLNADMASQPDHSVTSYRSYAVASAIGEDSDLVHEIVFATDGGANGITILKGNFDSAMQARSSPECDDEM